MKFEQLKPYEKNAKLHSADQIRRIAESIQEFGWRQPIVPDKDGVIVIGTGRYCAYRDHGKEMNLPEPWIVPADDLTGEQTEKLRLLDNKLNESPWDLGMLQNFDQNLLTAVGFSGNELDSIFEEVVTEDPFDVQQEYEGIKKPQTKQGDLYILGEHRLFCGDSTKQDDVNILMGGGICRFGFHGSTIQHGL